MTDHTHIQWTDATWNPVTGCSVVSAGCRHCYAMRLAGGRLRHHPSRAGLTRATSTGPVWTGEVRLNEEWLNQPLRWREPRRIFVCAHGDLFHPAVPDEWIDRVFAMMALARRHTFQVLTKRPERMREYIGSRPRDSVYPSMAVIGDELPGSDTHYRVDWPLPNCWAGVSVEDQAAADERIPLLLATPAAVRFISAEPLLGPVDLARAAYGEGHERPGVEIQARQLTHPVAGLDWVIVGGESGPRARPCEGDWIRSIVKQCRAAEVACFVKQLGSRPFTYLRSRAGSDPAEWPADLNVREFPA